MAGSFEATDSPSPTVAGYDVADVVVGVFFFLKNKYEDLPEKFDTVGESGRGIEAVKEGGGKGGDNPAGGASGSLPPASHNVFVVTSTVSVLKKLKPFVEEEKLKPVIGPKGPFPIEAFSHIQSGRATGTAIIYPMP
ncbi:unnamed protein product [Coffea canephora]|uniref:Uncharacterized protein n=1 Tax=Coffea canephora TaxID=49390 RepID=A0A068U3D5_COFCA|nr:unnamed protein product [Coffea canephora]